jgi:hypothetical protein
MEGFGEHLSMGQNGKIGRKCPIEKNGCDELTVFIHCDGTEWMVLGEGIRWEGKKGLPCNLPFGRSGCISR